MYFNTCLWHLFALQKSPRHPFKHDPLLWWQIPPSLQCPKLLLHFSPYVPLLQTLKKKRETYQSINAKWYFFMEHIYCIWIWLTQGFVIQPTAVKTICSISTQTSENIKQFFWKNIWISQLTFTFQLFNGRYQFFFSIWF